MHRQIVRLTRLFGVFTTFVVVWMLMDEPGLGAVVQALLHDRPVRLMLSLMCLAAGLAVVLGHQDWLGGIAPVLVTLVGWVLLARGVALLFVPANLLHLSVGALVRAGWRYLTGLVALGFGLILVFAGFRAPLIVPGEQ